MEQSSSGNRKGQGRQQSSRRGGQGGGRQGGHRSGGNRNRSGGNRNRGGRGGRRRRPEPKPTAWQKFIKAITFGAVDPHKSKKSKRKGSKARQPSDRKPRERRAPEVVEPTSPRLYVGNLSYDADNTALEDLFSQSGTVAEAAVVIHTRSGKSKGFAFVEMSTLDEAKAAVKSLNDSDFMGRKILVTGAKRPKPSEGGEEGRERRSERSESRREGGSRDRGGRERGGRRDGREGRERRDRRGRNGDRPEKTDRLVKPLKIEQVSSPVLSIRQLNSRATDDNIACLFDGVGTIQSREEVSGATEDDTCDIRVEMASTEEAQRAVEFLHGKAFMGNQLTVTGAEVGSVAEVKEEAFVEEEAPAEQGGGEGPAVMDAEPVDESTARDESSESLPEISKDESP